MSCRDAFFLHKSPLVFLNPLAEKHSEVQWTIMRGTKKMGGCDNFLPQIYAVATLHSRGAGKKNAHVGGWVLFLVMFGDFFDKHFYLGYLGRCHQAGKC
jgi:hypothetical protein